jgi:membrane-associated phospholipid phosphatase
MPSKPIPLPANPPFLARHPWVGFILFLAAAAAFTFLTIQVVDKGPITQWDLQVALAIHAYAIHQPGYVILVIRGLSVLGREGLALICILFGIAFIRTNQMRELGMVIMGVIGGELWFEILSNVIGRTRPAFKDPFETLIGPGYPSGHATTSLLLAWMILYLLLPRVRSPLWRVVIILVNVLLVIGIGWSRLFLGLHYPSDVAAGYLLGLAWGGLVYTLIDLYFFRSKAFQYQRSSGRELPMSANKGKLS